MPSDRNAGSPFASRTEVMLWPDLDAIAATVVDDSIVVAGAGRWGFETWTWADAAWSRALPSPAPKLVPAESAMVTFEGRAHALVGDEIWSWNGHGWTEHPVGLPELAGLALAVHDDTLMLFGVERNLSPGESQLEAWEWSGDGWSRRGSALALPDLDGHLKATTVGDGVIVAVSDALWRWANDGWSPLPTFAPDGRLARRPRAWTVASIRARVGPHIGGGHALWRLPRAQHERHVAVHGRAVGPAAARRGSIGSFRSRDRDVGQPGRAVRRPLRTRRNGDVGQLVGAASVNEQAFAVTTDPSRGTQLWRWSATRWTKVDTEPTWVFPRRGPMASAGERLLLFGGRSPGGGGAPPATSGKTWLIDVD